MPKRTHTHTVIRPEQLAAMASPVRLEVLGAVRVNGPCSIAQIGEFLGRAPDSLYYHIRRLVKVGLVLESGKRKTRRRDETLYRTPARRFRTPLDPADQRKSARVVRIQAAQLRLTERDLRAAVRNALAIPSGPRRNIRHGRIKGWLSQAELRAVHEHIDRIVEIFERDKSAGPRTQRKLYSITAFLLPIQPRRRVRTATRPQHPANSPDK